MVRNLTLIKNKKVQEIFMKSLIQYRDIVKFGTPFIQKMYNDMFVKSDQPDKVELILQTINDLQKISRTLEED